MKKILLLSDTHGHLDSKIKNYVKQADEVWHAGDIGKLSILDELEALKPLRAVYGNIDGNKVRLQAPEVLSFYCEGIAVLITHIAGYPGRYTPQARSLITQHRPKLFICGHSHILKVMYDKKNQLLHMNPGAVGDYGIHQVNTILCFTIDGKDIKDLRVVEFPRSKG